MKSKNILILLTIVISLFSCYDDEGNYIYKELGDVEVTNVSQETALSAKYGDSLIIDPGLVTNIDESELLFTWISDRGGLTDTIGTEKVLSRIADFGTSTILFTVRHEASDVLWKFETFLFVNLPFEKGWAILSNTNNNAKFNFLSAATEGPDGIDYVYYPNVYSKANGESLPVSAKNLVFASGDSKWMIQYDDDAICFDNEAMLKTNYLSEYFSTMEYVNGPLKPEFIGFWQDQSSYGMRFVTTGGDLFPTTNVEWGRPFSFAAPIEGDHYIGNYVTPITWNNEYLVFDEAKNRYLWIAFGSNRIKSQLPNIIGTEVVDVADLKMDCRWMKQVNWLNVYAVLKDESGDYHLHGMSGNDFTIEFVDNVVFEAGRVNENTLYATGGSRIYFATGKDLHFYNTENKTFTYNYLEFDDDILALSVHNNNGELVVAVKDGENSKVLLVDYYVGTLADGLIETVNVEGHVVSLVRRDW